MRLPLALVAAIVLAAPSAPAAAQAAQPPAGCRDPWITRAVREAARRPPRGSGDAGECDLRLYGARWGSYDELRGQVATTFAALRDASLEHDDRGQALRDRRTGRLVPLGGVYLGPDRHAPERQVTVTLARAHVLAFDWPPPERPASPSSPPPPAAGLPSHQE